MYETVVCGKMEVCKGGCEGGSCELNLMFWVLVGGVG
jgi:hypothetical protein